MRFLWSPRWVAAHLVVVALGLACVYLGLWQLDRHDTQRLNNAVWSARYAQEPIDIVQISTLEITDLTSLEYRRGRAVGEFVPTEEVLVRSQVLSGRAGFHVITPLLLEEGEAVIVNRGWVPLEFDRVPVAGAPPPAGRVTVEGLIRLSAVRSALGRDDSTDDRLTTISRIDLDLLDRHVTGDVLDVYLEVVGPAAAATALPVPGTAPDFSDAGPHLGYAIQWFSFALVGIVGYGFLIRRAARRGGSREGHGQPIDDLDSLETSDGITGEPDLGRAGAGTDDNRKGVGDGPVDPHGQG